MRDFLVYSLPVVLNEVMWGLGTSANTAVLGHMGSSAVAANSVAQVARQLATVVSFGLSSATAIYLGKTIGERKFDHARAYAKRFIILSVVMGVIGGGLILIASPVVISFLSLSATARYYLKMMFYVMSYFVIAQAFNTTMVVGIFRWRRYEVWLDHGCINDVGMFDFIRSIGCICITLECAGSLCIIDE